VHAIGFIWHSHASSSILSYSHHDQDLTRLDLVLIRGLYDKRITPRMPRLAALTAAKTVFAELTGAPVSTAADTYIERVIGYMRADAAAGDSYTQVQFGLAREYGQGLPKDESAALDWYRKAASLGNPQGEFRFGWLLHQGHGAPRDTAAAATWYRKAAEANVAIAQNNLGVLLEKGDGVSPDPVEAYKWYCVAAKAQLPIAEGNKKKFAATLSPEQIAEAERRAAAWKPNETGK
jgi:TPR repeat protein